MKHQRGHCWKGQLKPGQQACGFAGRKQQEKPCCTGKQGGGMNSPKGLPILASGVGVYTTGAYESGLRAREFYSFIARRAQALCSASPAGRLEESHPSMPSLPSAYSSFAFRSSVFTLSLSTCGSVACRSFSFSRVSSASRSLAFLQNSLTLPSPTFLKNFCACERIWLRVLPRMKDWIFFQFLPYFSMSSSKRSAYAAVHRPSRVRRRWVSGGGGLLIVYTNYYYDDIHQS